MTLEVRGVTHDQAALWFSTDTDITYVTPDELAVLRRTVADTGEATFDGIALDESDIDHLIVEFNRAQPLYPLEPCRDCGADAYGVVDGEFFCAGHELGIRLREDESDAREEATA